MEANPIPPSISPEIESKPEGCHHLLRVRIRKNIFAELKEIANDQSIKVGEYISISDLVRAAIGTYLQTQRSKDRLEMQLNPRKLQ